MFFHIAERIGVPGSPGGISQLLDMGDVAVDIFLLLSGYCVYKSWEKDSNLIHYYSKRLIRIFVPYLIFGIPLFLLYNYVSAGTLNIHAVIGDITSFNFWINGSRTMWFVFAILLYYFILPFESYLIQKKEWIGVCIIISTYIFNQFLWWLMPSYSGNSIAWTRLPIFTIGVFLSCYDIKISVKRAGIIKYLFVIIAVLFVLIFPYRSWYRKVFGHRTQYLWIGLALLVPGSLWIISKFVNHLPGWFNHILGLIGSVSLELYIIHLLILKLFEYLRIQEVLKGWCYIIVPAISIGVALLYLLCEKTVHNALARKSQV